MLPIGMNTPICMSIVSNTEGIMIKTNEYETKEIQEGRVFCIQMSLQSSEGRKISESSHCPSWPRNVSTPLILEELLWTLSPSESGKADLYRIFGSYHVYLWFIRITSDSDIGRKSSNSGVDGSRSAQED